MTGQATRRISRRTLVDGLRVIRGHVRSPSQRPRRVDVEKANFEQSADRASQLSAPERERQLREAARKYLAGEVDYQTLTVIRRQLDAPRRPGRS